MRFIEFKEYGKTLKQLQHIRNTEKLIKNINFTDGLVIKGESGELLHTDFYCFDDTYKAILEIKNREVNIKSIEFADWTNGIEIRSVNFNRAVFDSTCIEYLTEEQLNKVGDEIRRCVNDFNANEKTYKYMTFTELTASLNEIMQRKPEIDKVEFDRKDNSFVIYTNNSSSHRVYCIELEEK